MSIDRGTSLAQHKGGPSGARRLKSQPQQRNNQQQQQKTATRNHEGDDDVPHTTAVVRDLPWLADLGHRSRGHGSTCDFAFPADASCGFGCQLVDSVFVRCEILRNLPRGGCLCASDACRHCPLAGNGIRSARPPGLLSWPAGRGVRSTPCSRPAAPWAASFTPCWSYPADVEVLVG